VIRRRTSRKRAALIMLALLAVTVLLPVAIYLVFGVLEMLVRDPSQSLIYLLVIATIVFLVWLSRKRGPLS
jgi:protein-S-isoprenylcysteine O-methyltransferase Ste14